jgi:solute carrier family 35 protein F1/2
MCQNEGSTWSTKHNISEYRPLLPSPSIDDSYHSFPSPTDSSWTGRLLKLRRNSSESACNANDNDRAPYSVILFGQTIAAALAIGNFSISSLENKYDIHMPALTMGVVYLILSFHLPYIFIRQLSGRRKENAINDIETAGENESTHFFPLANIQLQTPWHAYLLLAVLDVEANYLTMLSFKHTSLSSSMLLTSLSVFSTLLFRRCIFGKSTTSYNYKKIIGVFVSVVGACIWIRKDFYQNSHDIISSTGRYTMVGDCLAVASALIYGLNDVLLEYTVKSNNDRIEYLGMIGLFGFLFSFFIQAPIFERDEIADLMHNFSDVDFADVWVLALLFILMMSYFYISVTIFLSVNDATILNLSLQSSPLWAVILTTFVTVGGDVSKFQLPSTVFFVALAMVVFGMCLYEI